MAEEELVDVKFRLYDGSDIGPFRYSVASTVDMLKQRIMLDWPKGKEVVPKAVNEVKLISSGKVLDNNRTVGECRMHIGGDVAGGAAIIMHVVVQQSLAKTKSDKKIEKSPNRIVCSCSIL
ncbi:Membrane-anchored ubiquitin-fold protein 3 [Linum perenne]